MNSDRSTLTAELVAVWSDIQRRHADLPGLSEPEALLADTSFVCGRELDFDRVLHEAAHGLAIARGIRDTSRGGRYHNRRFLAVALELGLVHPGRTSDSGFVAVRASAETRVRYRETIERWNRAIEVNRQAMNRVFSGPASRRGSSGGGKRAKVTCDCGRILYVVRSVLSIGPITCAACEQEFR